MDEPQHHIEPAKLRNKTATNLQLRAIDNWKGDIVEWIRPWGVIGRWIQNDVDYDRKMDALKRLFADYGILGAVLFVIYSKQHGEALIEKI